VAGEFTPLSVSIFATGFDEAQVAHLRELIARLLPALQCVLVRDPLSPALPRWVDVADFDPADHMDELPTPGDGTLRAVLDWAGSWANEPLPRGRPPWRQVFFRDVVVDGVPGRMVALAQMHHSVIDGEGGKRMADHYLQWAPDQPVSELPDRQAPEDITVFGRWREGWALEGRRAAGVARRCTARAGWAVRHPAAAGRRARELASATRRLKEKGSNVPLSPLLVRRSEALRFDLVEVDMAAFKAGCRAVGGTVNDGLMAAMGFALHRWHAERGVQVPAIRTGMAMATRAQDASGHSGNDHTSLVVHLPMDTDDVAELVRRSGEAARAAKADTDRLLMLDRMLAMSNRLPARLMARASADSMRGIDLQMSNVNGIPAGYWLAGCENLRTIAFMAASHAAVQLIMGSTGDTADIGLTTCPVAIPDPEHLVELIQAGFSAVADLAGHA
jgi:WS/DGAT/MGAT family acyltransferase